LGGYWNFVTGILLYQFAILLDGVDGTIARLTNKDTLGGIYLDALFSTIFRGLLLLAIGIGLFRMSGNAVWIILGVWTCLFLLFDNLNKLKVYETFVAVGRLDLFKDLKKSYEKWAYLNRESFFSKIKNNLMKLIRPDDQLSLIFFALILNLANYYLILMAILSPIGFAIGFVRVYKKIGNMKPLRSKS
jgi:hypothetical protein